MSPPVAFDLDGMDVLQKSGLVIMEPTTHTSFTSQTSRGIQEAEQLQTQLAAKVAAASLLFVSSPKKPLLAYQD